MRLPWKSKRPRVHVKHFVADSEAEGGRLYEIQPETYAGPWTLPTGTVLEVVSMHHPAEEKK